MTTMFEVRPGDIMFGPIGGFVPGVFPVGVGQLLLRAATRETWRVRHVAVVVKAASEDFRPRINWSEATRGARGRGPRIVQAMPSGAEEIEIGPEHFTNDYIYIRPAYTAPEGSRWFDPGLTVAEAAREYVGTPYSFLDYVALAGLHLGIENGPVRRYVRSTGHMICSQLADQALTDAGWHTFSDGRLPQDVMPAALFRQLLLMPGQHRTGLDGRWTENG